MIINNYNKIKPFAGFLAGIAGLKGIPLWTFYVNRGQGICSFGINNKDNSITEVFPAHQAYQNVSYNGFRTFIKGEREGKNFYFEPFTEFLRKTQKEEMNIHPNQLEIDSLNEEDGIRTHITYFTMPNENYAGLVRKVTITNTVDSTVSIELLDGLPAIIPYGIDFIGFKTMGNTLKAWMDVFNLDNKVPVYKVRSSTADSAKVEEINSGYFYLSFLDGEIIQPIVDAKIVFDNNLALTYPENFLQNDLEHLLNTKQVTSNKVPCGFSGVKKELKAGESVEFYTIIGFMEDVDKANDLTAMASFKKMDQKQAETNIIVDELLNSVETKTGISVFDDYIKQCFLDNMLRGGFPIILADKVYYVYSRKHGDLERDYNYFSIAPEYYSQGNGNFRDVNQNRRNDIFFNPSVGDFNIKMFFSFIQADGYNPLLIQGTNFLLDTNKVTQKLDDRLNKFFEKSFTPGKLMKFAEDNNITINEELTNEIFANSSQILEANFGEGYWIDHFTYNLDLIEAYKAIYPDKMNALLFEDNSYMFYDSPAIVSVRKKKYVKTGEKIRQYNAIIESKEKEKLIKERLDKTPFGKFMHIKDNQLYTTNLYVKLFALAVTKFSLLDPYGMGIEMEANKPGWNDSLNGMPGLFGSGVSELIELKRIIDFMLQIDDIKEKTVEIPEELVELSENLFNINEIETFNYWDKSANYREEYREKTNFGFSGNSKVINIVVLNKYLSHYIEIINAGLDKCLIAGNGIYPTYFTYEVSDYEVIEDNESYIKVKEFKQHMLPYFLEGPARGLKVADKKLSKSIHQKVQESNIYDKKLKMYKVNESIQNESFEIGRSRAFTPGWLENESVFMHMEYKYMLSMLKSGLYNEFFEEIKNVMPPFMNPEVYGRSILENSSFIASSANPDESIHGNGYVARLSGSTAEMISMWFIMFAGEYPFVYKDNKLTLELKPSLPGWIFDADNKVCIRFLGNCDLTYHNPERHDTYEGLLIKRIILFENGKAVEIKGSIIEEGYAQKIRDGLIEKIDVFF